MTSNQEEKSKKNAIFNLSIALFIVINFLIILFFTNIIHDYTLNFNHKYAKFIYLELIILYFAMITMLLLVKKWLKMKTNELRYLLLVFLMDIISLSFLILKKILDYIIVEEILPEDSYLKLMIYNFRFSLIFGTLTGLYMYHFYVDMFKLGNIRSYYGFFIRVLTLFVICVQFIPTNPQDYISRFIIGSIAYVQWFFAYIPIIIQTYRLWRAYDKNADFSNINSQIYYNLIFLFLVAFCFLMVGISYILSIVFDLITNTSYGLFYYIQTIFTFLVVIFSYMGFVMPKWFRSLLSSKKTDKISLNI